MADQLTHPATGSVTTTITFDGIVDIARGRTAMNSEDFGGTDGTSRQAASNRTKADIQISFIFKSESGTSVRDKVKELADWFKANAKDDVDINIDFADGGTLQITGKVVDERGTFIGGQGAVKYQGTLDVNIATETWS